VISLDTYKKSKATKKPRSAAPQTIRDGVDACTMVGSVTDHCTLRSKASKVVDVSFFCRCRCFSPVSFSFVFDLNVQVCAYVGAINSLLILRRHVLRDFLAKENNKKKKNRTIRTKSLVSTHPYIHTHTRKHSTTQTLKRKWSPICTLGVKKNVGRNKRTYKEVKAKSRDAQRPPPPPSSPPSFQHSHP
jgi:hypothetical protein